IDDRAGIDNLIDARDAQVPARVHLNLDDRRNVRIEAAMRRDAEAPAAAGFLLSPTRLLTGHFENPPQPAAVDGISVERCLVVRIVQAMRFEVDQFAEYEHVVQALAGIAYGSD